LCTLLILLVFAVPYLRLPLGLVVLEPEVWVTAIIASLIPLLVIQLYKIYANFKTK